MPTAKATAWKKYFTQHFHTKSYPLKHLQKIMAKIMIPTPLRKFTNNQASLEVQGADVSQAFEELAQTFPGLRTHLFDEQGAMRKFLRVYVGDEDIKTLEGEKTAIRQDTVVSIIPAIAGGMQ
jgi:molybdopterin converting factor small subunit